MEPFDRVSMHIKWWPFRFLEWLNRLASKVGQEPLLDNEKFDWIPTVEAATDDILAELHNIQATVTIPSPQEILENQVVLSDDDQWKLFFLYGYGYRDEHNCQLCPATDRAVQSVPGLQSVMFSVLEPGKRLRPHRGPYNGFLRYHLGLIIPDGGTTSFLRVADKTCHWQVGSSLVFDDTYDHEACNDSDKQRVVLFIDFERPMRFPINYLNKFVLFAVRLSPPIRQAIRNIKNYRGGKPAPAVH
jgi:beta-hydroxylase